jgi:hypothetical protein
MSPTEKEALMQALGTFVCDEVARANNSLRKEVLEPTLRLNQAELQVREFRYAGVWTDRSSYRKGNTVSHAGSLWHCNIDDTATMPGADHVAWTMCVKRGADAPVARS